MWQDYVLAIGMWVFSIALIPAIIAENDKPPKSTCLLTAITLSVFVVTLLTLKLILGGIAEGVLASLWWILFFQKRR